MRNAEECSSLFDQLTTRSDEELILIPEPYVSICNENCEFYSAETTNCVFDFYYKPSIDIMDEFLALIADFDEKTCCKYLTLDTYGGEK
jgi:hypothetical protein